MAATESEQGDFFRLLKQHENARKKSGVLKEGGLVLNKANEQCLSVLFQHKPDGFVSATPKNNSAVVPSRPPATNMKGMITMSRQDNNPINHSGDNGQTPAHCASTNGRFKCLELLINHGCNLNLLNAYGETPAFKAAEGGHEACLELILKANGDVRTPDFLGRTPLDVAANTNCRNLLGNQSPLNLCVKPAPPLVTKGVPKP